MKLHANIHTCLERRDAARSVVTETLRRPVWVAAWRHKVSRGRRSGGWMGLNAQSGSLPVRVFFPSLDFHIKTPIKVHQTVKKHRNTEVVSVSSHSSWEPRMSRACRDEWQESVRGWSRN